MSSRADGMATPWKPPPYPATPTEREALAKRQAALGVQDVAAPTITDEELTRRFTRSIGGPNPMYRCNGCGYEEYGVHNLLVKHARTCGVEGRKP